LSGIYATISRCALITGSRVVPEMASWFLWFLGAACLFHCSMHRTVIAFGNRHFAPGVRHRWADWIAGFLSGFSSRLGSTFGSACSPDPVSVFSWNCAWPITIRLYSY